MSVGNATAQAKSHADIHEATNSGGVPIARTVAMPETRNDMIPERIRAIAMGAKRAGSIGRLGQ